MSTRMGSITAELARPAAPASSRATTSTDATSATKPTKPNGRPKRTPFVKLHVTIDEQLADYVNEAWRTHRTIDGSFVNGPSAFLEDLVARHRAASDNGKP